MIFECFPLVHYFLSKINKFKTVYYFFNKQKEIFVLAAILLKKKGGECLVSVCHHQPLVICPHFCTLFYLFKCSILKRKKGPQTMGITEGLDNMSSVAIFSEIENPGFRLIVSFLFF